MVATYLDEYVSKGAKEVSGGDFARLVNQLHIAQWEHGLADSFNARLLERIIQVFIRTYKDSVFSAKDIVQLEQGFKSMLLNVNMPERFTGKLDEALHKIASDLTSGNDADYLTMLRMFDDKGMLSDDLIHRLRENVEIRFDYMPRDTLLDYCELMKDLGLLFEDTHLIGRLESYFKNNFSNFTLPELFKLLKL